ncbi:MAG: MFS transporter [Anaerolineales bacterium]
MQAESAAIWPYKRLFSNTNFLLLWLGHLIAYIGDYFILLAVPIVVERLTGSTLMVGLSVISEAIPMLMLGPVAGVFIDRWNRKRIMIMSCVVRAMLVLILLVVQRADQVWFFYLVGFLMSTVSRFFSPAMNALLPLIVEDPDDLLNANGLMQLVMTVGLLAGPALAGFIIDSWGASAAYWVESVCLMIAAAMNMFVHVPKRKELTQNPAHDISSVLNELWEGIGYLFSNRTMFGVLVVLLVTQLGFGAINVVWVPYLQRTFGIGPKGLGIVDAAQGLGMIFGGIALGFLSKRLVKTTLAGGGAVVIGIFFAAIGLAPGFIYVIVFSFLVGFGFVPAQSAIMTLIQLAVPNQKLGRVSSANLALRSASGLISMALAAAFAEAIGHRTVYVLCGLIVVLGGILAFIAIREPEIQAEVL